MGKQYDKRRAEKAFLKFVIAGVLFMLLPLIYFRPSYDNLQTKDIRVSSIGSYASGGRYSSLSYYLLTVDGDRYEILGDFTYSELKEALQPNTPVAIKFYRGLNGITVKNHIKELSRDGEILVSYRGNEQLENQIVMTCIGLVIIGIGFMYYNWQTDFIRNIRNKRLRARRENNKPEKGRK